LKAIKIGKVNLTHKVKKQKMKRCKTNTGKVFRRKRRKTERQRIVALGVIKKRETSINSNNNYIFILKSVSRKNIFKKKEGGYFGL